MRESVFFLLSPSLVPRFLGKNPRKVNCLYLLLLSRALYSDRLFIRFSSFLPSLAVPPSKPKIFDERNQEVRLKLGPYKIGDEVSLKCSATGGKKQL